MASGGRVSGSNELSWSTKVDVEQSKTRLKDLKDSFTKVNTTVEEGILIAKRYKATMADMGKLNVGGIQPANNGNWKNQQAVILQALANTRKELAELKNAYQELKNKQEEGKISIQGLTEQIAQQKLRQAELRTELDAGKLSQSVYNDMIAESKVRQQELNEAVKKQTLSDKEYTRQLKEKAQAEKDNKAALKASHASYQAAAGSYEEANKKAQGLLKSIRTAPGGFEKMSQATRIQVAEYIKLNAQLTAFDAGLGNHQRNVGNYASGFSGLSNSINQITRELPAFTFSAQTGFLALSNNIPILFDEIGKVNRVLKETSLGSAQAAGDQARATSLAGGASEEAASQVGDLAKAQALQAAEGQRGVGMLKAISSALFSWGTLLSVGVTLLTVYGKEIGEWVGALFQGKEAIDELTKSQKILQDASTKGRMDSITEVTNLKVLYKLSQDNTLSLKQRKDAVSELQKQWPEQFKNLKDEVILAGNAKKAYDLLTASIVATAKARAYQDVIAENAKRKFSNDEELAKKEIEYNDSKNKQKLANDKAYMAATTRASDESALQNDSQITQANAARRQAAKEIRDIKKDNYLLDQRDLKLQEEIAKQVKAGGKITDYVDPTKAAAPKQDSLLNARNTLQNEIKDLIRGSVKIQMDADTAEIEAVTIKYDKIRRKAEEHYDKVNKLIKDPKKRAAYNLDLSGVNKAEVAEKATVTYDQGTKALKESLDKQKELYAEYENYKINFGKEAADKKYSKELNVFLSYLDVLKAKENEVTNDPTSMDKSGRFKLLSEFTDAAIGDENKRLNQSLKDFQAYAAKRKVIAENAVNQAKEFREKGLNAEADEVTKQALIEITALDDANLQKMDSYRTLFDFIGQRSKQSTLEAIDQYEKDLLASDIAEDLKKKKIAEVNALRREIKKDSGADLENVLGLLSGIANEFTNINGSIGSIAAALVNAGRSYVEVRKGITDIKDPSKSATEKVGAGLGIVGAAISVASTVVSYFKGLKAANEAAKKYMDDYNRAAVQGELDYQALLRKRELDDVARGKTSYQGLLARLELLKKQSPQLQAAYDKVLQSLQGGESIEGVGRQHGTWLRKTKTWDIMASLAGSDYAELERLYSQGKLKDAAKADFEALRALREELKAAGISVEELGLQLNEMLTGTSVEGLSDALSDLFENGKTAAADFGDTFENVMRKAILNSFKLNVIQKAMQPVFDSLGSLFADGKIPGEKEIQKFLDYATGVGSGLGDQFKVIDDLLKKLNLGGADAVGGMGLAGTITTPMNEESANTLVSVYKLKTIQI